MLQIFFSWRYYLFISESSKKKLQEEIDEFSDSYYWDLDLADIKQVNVHSILSCSPNSEFALLYTEAYKNGKEASFKYYVYQWTI